MDFLKAQFNPHFLFNSINSIYGHIDKKNAMARNMLLTFSNMLRYQLYECNSDHISVEKEIGYLKNYVLLQQIRKEEDLVVRMIVEENVAGFTIAPLLFIAFIENAFKFVGCSNQGQEEVHISFAKRDDRLLFRVQNTKDPACRADMTPGGIGIVNVKRRLELLYPGEYELGINDLPTAYEVNLNLVIK